MRVEEERILAEKEEMLRLERERRQQYQEVEQVSVLESSQDYQPPMLFDEDQFGRNEDVNIYQSVERPSQKKQRVISLALQEDDFEREQSELPNERENFWTQVMVGHSIDLAANYPVDDARKRKIVDHFEQLRETAMRRAEKNGDSNEVFWEIAWQVHEEVNANWSHIQLQDVHPLDHYVDLSCLSPQQAKVILTQKLVDLAETAQAYPLSNQLHGP